MVWGPARTALPSRTHSRPHSFLQRRRARPVREFRMWELVIYVMRGQIISRRYLGDVKIPDQRWIFVAIKIYCHWKSKWSGRFMATSDVKLSAQWIYIWMMTWSQLVKSWILIKNEPLLHSQYTRNKIVNRTVALTIYLNDYWYNISLTSERVK